MPTIAFEHLTTEQRLALIGEIWNSLEANAVPLTSAQQAELDRRLASAEADRASSVTWEALRAEISCRRS
jgi:putative addiction module component (TIGR02574 family)